MNFLHCVLNPGRCAVLLLVACLAGSSCFADHPTWPQFRGPDGQGNSSENPLPRIWDQTRGITWKVAIPGMGHSSPVHDGSTIWLTTAPQGGNSLQAIAIDPESGKITRQIEIFTPQQVAEIHHTNSHASPTPVLFNKHLYVHFGCYGTACINTSSGDVVWRNTDYPVSHEGGPGSSPVIFEDLLILTLDGADSQRLIALNLESGKPRWVRDRSAPYPPGGTERRAFSTPLLIEHDGRPMLISPGAQQCHAYNPRTGEELWHVRYVGFSNVPRPVYNGTSCFICTGFFNPELWAVDPGGSGNVTDTHVQWKFKGEVPETPSPLVVGNSIYILSNKGVLTILSAKTGKREGLLRVGGNYSASPFHSQGIVYVCNEDGMVKLLDSTLAKPKVIQINRMEERIMASPAVIGRDLLIRTDAALYRIHDTAESSTATTEP